MNNENQEPKNRGIKALSVVAGMLVGGVVGAVTMLLFAPQSGEETRGQIQEKGIELLDQANEMMDDAMTQVRMDRKEIAVSGQEKAKELLEQGKALVAEQLDNVSEAVQGGKRAIQNA